MRGNLKKAAHTKGMKIEVTIYDRDGHVGGRVEVEERCFRQLLSTIASIRMQADSLDYLTNHHSHTLAEKRWADKERAERKQRNGKRNH